MAMIKQVAKGEGVALSMPDGTEVLVFFHGPVSNPRSPGGASSQINLRIHAPRSVKIDSADERYDSIEEQAPATRAGR
jgi:hypothetical protein